MYYGGGRGKKRFDTDEIVNLFKTGNTIIEIAKLKAVSHQRITAILQKELGIMTVTFTSDEIFALKDLIFEHIDDMLGIDKIDPDLVTALAKLRRK